MTLFVFIEHRSGEFAKGSLTLNSAKKVSSLNRLLPSAHEALSLILQGRLIHPPWRTLRHCVSCFLVDLCCCADCPAQPLRRRSLYLEKQKWINQASVFPALETDSFLCHLYPAGSTHVLGWCSHSCSLIILSKGGYSLNILKELWPGKEQNIVLCWKAWTLVPPVVQDQLVVILKSLWGSGTTPTIELF